MKFFSNIFLIVVCFFLIPKTTFSQLNQISLDYPQIKNGEIVENKIKIQSDTNDIFSFLIKIFKSDNLLDSVLLKEINLKNINIKKGYNSINISNEWSNLRNERLDYFEIIRYTNNFPPGKYIISVSNLQQSINTFNYWQVDSLLCNESSLFKNLEADYNTQMDKLKSGSNLLGKLTSKKINIADFSSIKLNKVNDKLLEKADRDIQLNFPQIRVEKQLEGTTGIFNFYYKNNFIGTYHWDIKKAPQKVYEEEKEKLITKSKNLFDAEADKYKTLIEKFNEKKKKALASNEIKSEIQFDTYMSNDQEEYSNNDNFYSEIAALTKVKLLGIPFVVDGYYTTQDRNRTIKSSYVRLEYDLESAKSELEKNINSFKEDYTSKKTELFKLENIYGNYIKKLSTEKDNLLNGLKSEFDISKLSNFDWESILSNPSLLNKIDTNQLFQTLIEKGENELEKDSVYQSKKEQLDAKRNLLKEKRELAKEKYEKAQKAIKKILEIEEKVRKYYALINQTKNSLKLDSGIVMDKLKEFDKNEDLSYNSLLKRSKEILPKNDFTKFTKGLNKLNFGLLNNYESEYTISNQSVKGLNVEYSIKKITIGALAGKTEFVSRDLNNLDVYNSFMLKAASEINENQKIKFIYFSYSPSAKMLKNDFYNNIKNNIGKFDAAKELLSVVYEANLFKSLSMNADIAKSLVDKNEESKKTQWDMKSVAYKIALDYTPGKLPIGTTVNYESVGAEFVNESLAFIRKDFSALNVVVHGDLFKGYLKGKISFQELLKTPQDNTFRSRKWGVDIRTTSKRYPNLLLSYKPFATFSSINDTFNIAQRPLVGEVITSKISYQKKGKIYSHQAYLIYNKNRTNMDTTDYNSEVIQFNYTINKKGQAQSIQFGRMKMPEVFSTANNKENYFIRLSEQVKVFKRLNFQLSEEIAWYKNSINRWGVTLGTSYSIPKRPIAIRCQVRYLSFLNSEFITQKIYGANLGFTYNFSFDPKK